MSKSYELSGVSPGKYTNNADQGESGLVNKGYEAEEGNGQVPASDPHHVADHYDIDLNSKNQQNRGNSNNKYNDDGGDDGDDNDNGNDDSWEDLDDDENPNACSIFVGKFQNWLSEFVTRHGTLLRTAFLILLLLGYYAYFGYAMYYEFGSEGSVRLLVCTVVAVLILSYHLYTKYRKSRSPVKEDVEDDDEGTWAKRWNRFAEKTRFATSVQILLIIGFIVLICADIAPNNPRNLMSLTGMAFFVITFYIFSYNPSKVKWRPVILGLAIQIIFALLILRTTAGYEAFKWLGNRVKEFLDYTDEGSKFVFGDKFQNHYFAFKVLPVVIFFSTVVSMLYYLGVMQVLIRLIGKFLALCLGTSPTESINAAANIFIGQTEAPLLIRPFLNDMTNSEIHAVMTGGFATIAGSVMAAYILYDVPANHLLSASVMSAPAALAFSKLFYPETKKTRIQAKDVYNLSKGSERNIIEAASNGASMAISLVANIAVNLIAFIALITFVNSTLIWFGDRVGYGELTFQNVCSYVFWPLSFLMGVEQDDCRKVAELIGTKTFLNEFVAYVALSEYIHNKENLTKYLDLAQENLTQNLTGIWYEEDGDIFLQDSGEILKNGIMSDRSVVITTYALCGFSNLASMGIQLGALGAMAPSRKGDMSRLVVRAMLAGNVACFMTACISGLLYEDK